MCDFELRSTLELDIDYGDVEKPKPFHKEQFEKLNNQRDTGQYCDIVLEVEGRSFKAHKCVLAAASSYFRAMFSCGLAESNKMSIELKDIDEKTFEMILDFTYGKTLKLDDENADELLKATNMLCFTSLQTQVERYKAKNITNENFFNIFKLAESMNLVKLKGYAKWYFNRNRKELSESETFLNMPYDLTYHLFEKERDVHCLESVLKWLAYKPEERSQYASKLFETFDYCMIDYRLMESIFETENIEISEAHKKQILAMPRQQLQENCSHLKSIKLGVFLVFRSFSNLKVASLKPSKSNIWKNHKELDDYGDSDFHVAFHSGNLYVLTNQFVHVLNISKQKWNKTNCKNRSRKISGICSHNGTIYTIGYGRSPFDFDRNDSSIDAYNMSDKSWKKVGSLKHFGFEYSVTANNDSLFVCSRGNRKDFTPTVEKFDLKTGSSAELSKIKFQVYKPIAVLFDNKIYIFSSGLAPQVYDMEKDEWTQSKMVCDDKHLRNLVAVKVINNRIILCYVILKSNSWYLRFYEYDPTEDKIELLCWYPPPITDNGPGKQFPLKVILSDDYS